MNRADFQEAGRLLMRLDPFSQVETPWRHHALGMLQAELSETLRIHVWHPELLQMPADDPTRCIHDHRFDLTSYVVAGAIMDIPVEVLTTEIISTAWMDRKWEAATMWEIRHAKIQTHDQSDFQKVGQVSYSFGTPRSYGTGEVYHIPRRRFHTTQIIAPCTVTLVHRANFTDEPARVLGRADKSQTGDMVLGEGGKQFSGICRDTSPQLIEKILVQADRLLIETIGRA